MNTETDNPIFRWSTPAPRPDGTIPPAWRVADRHALNALLVECCGWDFYTEHADTFRGRKALWFGLRDNRDPALHGARIEEISARLKARGCRVQIARRSGRASGIWIMDPEHKADARKGGEPRRWDASSIH